jgi:membrane dipeptidase
VCSRAGAIESAWREQTPAIVPCVENGHALGGDLDTVAAWRDAGVAYVTLTHNGHNALADSAIPRADLGDEPTRHGGLSAFGREAIAAFNRAGIVIDVAHASRDAMLQAAALSRTPIVSTHSCMRALCDHARNLDDAQLDVLRDVGGVVQVTMVPAFLRKGGKLETVTLSDLLDHVDHAVARIGIEHVGLGSDFDGGGGVVGWRHAGESAAVTGGLLARGYDPAAIAMLWGGNFLRVMRAAEAAAA